MCAIYYGILVFGINLASAAKSKHCYFIIRARIYYNKLFNKTIKFNQQKMKCKDEDGDFNAGSIII